MKKLYSRAPHVLHAFGENAGVVDLGQGERIAFKIESHNHPSFLVPYDGAATGVGGILRDILTMGARPVALGNYLAFGPQKGSWHLREVVRGISDYGNCIGVPMLTGHTEFHESYQDNVLVNVFALGYFGPDAPVVLSKMKGVGCDVVYIGAQTGRDGVHGASMSSHSFTEESTATSEEETTSPIQVGTPSLVSY